MSAKWSGTPDAVSRMYANNAGGQGGARAAIVYQMHMRVPERALPGVWHGACAPQR